MSGIFHLLLYLRLWLPDHPCQHRVGLGIGTTDVKSRNVIELIWLMSHILAQSDIFAVCLNTQSGDNNNTTSDFWLYSTDAFRLAKVQLTYDFPQQWFHGTIIKGLSAYVSGSNLLTIAKERELLELNVGSAPQSRFYNLGVKVSF